MWVADRHANLIEKGRTISTLEEAMFLGDPIRYEENDDGQANVYIEDAGWLAVTGEQAMIAGYAGVFGRTLKSLAQFEKVMAKHGGVVRMVRTDDNDVPFVTIKGAGEFLIVSDRSAIWKAAVTAIRDRF